MSKNNLRRTAQSNMSSPKSLFFFSLSLSQLCFQAKKPIRKDDVQLIINVPDQSLDTEHLIMINYVPSVIQFKIFQDRRAVCLGVRV